MAERMGPQDKHLDEEQIFGLAEGGLDASARSAAEAHLQGCAACRRELEIAAGYFKEIAGLEPVKAPANFLANVRARLPRPSPLRAFLDVFMRPLRVIPMQVALLTILGLTAISSYLYQRGGLEKAAANVISDSAPVRPDTIAPSTVSGSEGDDQPLKPSAPPRPVASAPPAREREERDDMKSDSRGTSALDKSEGYAAPSEPSAAAPSPGAGAPSPKKSSQALRPDLKQAAPPAPSVAMESAPAAEPARAEKPRAAKEAEVKEKQAEAKGGFRDEAMADSKDMQETPLAKISGNEGASGTAEPPVFIVKLAPGKRIGDVVSGLKAMGADSLSAWLAGDTGGKGMDYMFRVPASMRKEIAPYLERYGKVEGAGPLPAAGSDPSRIRIRFLP